MAAYVLIEHVVGDFEVFRRVYENDGPRRGRLGSKGAKVLRAAGNPNEVVILLEWRDLEGAHRFAESLELEEAMKWSTSNVATPRVTVLEWAMDSDV